jgi:two-component system catabolic regulation response regulator CreB
MQVLLVEDDPLISQSVRRLLEPTYQVTSATSREAAFNQIEKKNFDLIIVDLGLPDGSGIELCQYFQEEPDSPRILVLSGKSDTETKVLALQTGADDYLVKPFSPKELTARVRALLRRSKQKQQAAYHFGNMSVALSDQTIFLHNKKIPLTLKESTFMQALLRYRGQIVERKQLEEVLGREGKNRSALDTLVKTLRRKLQVPRKNRLLETIYGIGYRLNPHDA